MTDQAETRGAARGPGPDSVWHNRDFVRYWLGGAFTSVGTWLQAVTASILMYSMTGSSVMVGVLNFVNFTPVLLLSVVGGVLSDRVSRKLLVVLTHLFSAGVAATLAVLVSADLVGPGALLVAVGLIGASHALSKPTMSALLPALVPRSVLARATAANTLQFNLGQVIGPLLATVVMATAGAALAFAINALTFLGPIAAVMTIRTRLDLAVPERKTGLSAAKEGLDYIRANPRMLATLGCIVLAAASGEVLRVLAPEFVVVRLGREEEVAGLLVGAGSAGTMVGLVTFGALSRRLSARRLLAVGFLSQALGAWAVAASTTLPVAMAAALPIGYGIALLIPLLNTSLQELSSDAFRGRVMASFAMAHLGSRPLWAMGSGSLAGLAGPAVALGALGWLPLVGLRLMRTIGASSSAGGSVHADQGP